MYIWIKEPQGLEYIRVAQHNTWDSLTPHVPNWWPVICPLWVSASSSLAKGNNVHTLHLFFASL